VYQVKRDREKKGKQASFFKHSSALRRILFIISNASQTFDSYFAPSKLAGRGREKYIAIL
jgi:hypothetical protein